LETHTWYCHSAFPVTGSIWAGVGVAITETSSSSATGVFTAWVCCLELLAGSSSYTALVAFQVVVTSPLVSVWAWKVNVLLAPLLRVNGQPVALVSALGHMRLIIRPVTLAGATSPEVVAGPLFRTVTV
jgi:hypothetical protein